MVGTPHEIAKKLYFFSIETGNARSGVFTRNRDE